MGITKRGPNHFFIKARAKVFGEDRRKQLEFFGSKSAAEDLYIQIKRELRGDRREPQTFGDLLETYRESRGTLEGSQASVYKTLTQDLGAIALSELEGALKRYHAILKVSRSRVTCRPFGPAHLNRTRTMVAAALNLAVATKIIPESPLNAANWPKAKEIPRDRFLDGIEVQRLLNVVELEAPHLLPLCRFALLVPCRKSELINMTRADLDLFHNAIRVHNGTTKNEDGAWKPIPPELIPYFRTLPPESSYLFFRKVGETYRPLGDFKKAWTRCLKLAGIRNFHFHDTRHISATNMVDAGTPERVVMDVAGWRTNMLSTYYKSSSKRALEFVKFGPGRGNDGATSEGDAGKSSGNGIERAVS